MFDNASLEEDYQQIINLLSMYEETEDILQYICKCKERITELLSIRKEKEERICKAREKLEFVDDKVFFYAGKFYALNIYGIDTYYNLDKSDLTKALSWKERKNWLAIGDNIFVVFNNGKVGTISKGKSRYIKHYKYGEWDDIQQLAVSNSWDEMIVYGLTEDGRVRVENIQKDSGYRSHTYDAKNYFYYQVEEWTDIEKIKCTKDYVYGIKKNGTIEVCGRYGKYGFDRWSDIIDIFCVGDIDVIGLKKDGTLICSGIRDYMESICKWHDIVKVATSEHHVLGLCADGTVVFVKSNNVNIDKHCCDVEAWTNIIDIWAGENISIGLREDGTILSCGKDADKYRMRICYNVYNYQEEYTIYSDIKTCIEKKNELEKRKKNLVDEMKRSQIDTKKQNRFWKSLCENENQLKKEIEELEMEIIDVDDRINRLEKRFDEVKVCSFVL